jgi:putative transposase
VNAIVGSYLQGVSTRNVETAASHLGVNQISASYVSKVGRELDTKVQDFMERPVGPYYPYLFIDASYFKVRDESRYVNKALLIIVEVRTDGHREVSQPGLLMQSTNLPGRNVGSPWWISSSRMVTRIFSLQLG